MIRVVDPIEARAGDFIESFGFRQTQERQSAELRLAELMKREGVKRELVKTYVTKTKTWQLFLLP